MVARFGDSDLVLDHAFTLTANETADSVSFVTVKFYLSLVADVNGYILFDASQSVKYDVECQHARSISLGIDSTMNVSGAMGGALDPSLGMYWTWQSGYINAKLEGTVWNDGQPETFQYHLGGYSHPFNAYRPLNLPAFTDAIILDLAVFSENNDFSVKTVMRPCLEGNALSDWMSLSFTSE